MPIYEYSCAKCGKTIEVIQKFSDKPLKKHDKCGGSLTKLISASSFHLKGTGWYKTDYASTGKSESKDASGNGKKESGDQKTETPAEKSSSSETSTTTAKASSSKSEKPKSGASKS